MFDWLITLTVVAGIVALLVTMVRYPNARPYLNGLIVLAFIVTGALSAFTGWHYYNTHSNIVGEFEQHDPYEDFNYYEYEIEDFVLNQPVYNSLEHIVGYDYFISYATSIEFDGTKNQYELLLNNRPCEETYSAYGKLYGLTTICFDNVYGREREKIDLKITFTFYQSKIDLRISTNATTSNADMLQEYFKIEKFNLRIIEKINYSSPILNGGV